MKKGFSRLLSILLVLILPVLLIACDSGEDNSNTGFDYVGTKTNFTTFSGYNNLFFKNLVKNNEDNETINSMAESIASVITTSSYNINANNYISNNDTTITETNNKVTSKSKREKYSLENNNEYTYFSFELNSDSIIVLEYVKISDTSYAVQIATKSGQNGYNLIQYLFDSLIGTIKYDESIINYTKIKDIGVTKDNYPNLTTGYTIENQ